jgi:hypothetical protein
MSPTEPVDTDMRELLVVLSKRPGAWLEPGETISFQGKVAVSLEAESPQARSFLIKASRAVLRSEIPDDVSVRILEWAEILVEQGIVETGEVPDPDQAAWHAQVPDKISENA